MSTKRAIIFLHGIGGSTEGTWAQFPALLRADESIAKRFAAIEAWEYPTSLALPSTPLSAIAESLGLHVNELTHEHAFDEIAFICHSQGGLLVRRYIANVLAGPGDQARPLFRLLTFATPHWGAYPQTVGAWVREGRAQLRDLAIDSDFILLLNRNWAALDAEHQVDSLYVVAGDDGIVSETSAIGASYAHDIIRVPGHGHSSIVKPEDANHPSFGIAQQFLMRDASVHPNIVNADWQQPTLTNLVYAPSLQETARMVYRAQYVPFVGRDDEVRALDQFIDSLSPSNFAWMLVEGEGGVGKSRLALELCLAWQSAWYVGFLNADSDAPDWTRWQPLLPTLIVVDYATKDAEKLGKLLRGLANRDAAGRLRRPVRVVLLERSEKEEDLARAIGAGASAPLVGAARMATLSLETVSEPWRIIAGYLQRAGKPLPDEGATLAKLTAIDPKARPLFAMLLADAIAQDVPLVSIVRDDLVKDFIEREREKVWLPAAQNDRARLTKAEKILALATMCGGLTYAQVKDSLADLEISAEKYDEDEFAPIFCAATGGSVAQRFVLPLEPDIVGEWFVLNLLGEEPFSERERKFVDRAWGENEFKTLAFHHRLIKDFPEAHLLVHALCTPAFNNPRNSLPWGYLISQLVPHFGKNQPYLSLQAYRNYRAIPLNEEISTLSIQFQAYAGVALVKQLTETDLTLAELIHLDLCKLSENNISHVILHENLTESAFHICYAYTNHESEVLAEKILELKRCLVMLGRLTAPTNSDFEYADLVLHQLPDNGSGLIAIGRILVNLLKWRRGTQNSAMSKLFRMEIDAGFEKSKN